MSGPLSGIRVVDMTTMLSGPWAAMILADQGADVIKVEQPQTGDHVRSLGNQRAGMSAMFLNINRNKRSITVDMKSPRGRDVVRDLAKGRTCSCRTSVPAWWTGLVWARRTFGR